MWVSVDTPISTHGNHGKEFLLNLEYCQYFGHDHNRTTEIVIGVWDSISECFFEKETGMAIDERDIVQWWKD